mmetsp:Transcript_24243/g.50023  ORF Transcript_24243/g.50023 Transcript_24243/m.50023 type:complete len:116 (-) Transcript_24243:23-370(-)
MTHWASPHRCWVRNILGRQTTTEADRPMNGRGTPCSGCWPIRGALLKGMCCAGNGRKAEAGDERDPRPVISSRPQKEGKRAKKKRGFAASMGYELARPKQPAIRRKYRGRPTSEV